MQRDNPFTDWRILLAFLTAIVVIVADQLTKAWVSTYPLADTIASFGFLRIFHTQNTGASFGLFQGQVIPLKIIAMVSSVILILLAIFVYRRYSFLVTKWNGIAFGLVMGGTIGNLIDRLRFGQVTDFIDTGFWPTFNVADSAITIGAIMCVITLLRFALSARR